MSSKLEVSLCRSSRTHLALTVQEIEARSTSKLPSSLLLCFRDFYSEFMEKKLRNYAQDSRILPEEFSFQMFNQMGHFTYRATGSEVLRWIKIESSARISNVCGPRLLKALSSGKSFVTDVNLKLTRAVHLTLFYMLLASSSLADALKFLTVKGDPPEESGLLIGRMLLNLKKINVELTSHLHDRPSLKYLLSKVDKLENRNHCTIEISPPFRDGSWCFSKIEAKYFKAALKNERIYCSYLQ